MAVTGDRWPGRSILGALAFVGVTWGPCPPPLHAQGTGNVEIHGFLLGTYAGRTTGLRPGGEKGGDFLLAEERMRLDLSVRPESIEAALRVKGDVLHDALAGTFDLDLREAYVDYTAGDFDVRLGRQIATWGVGDLLFINDVFPKDWVSFLSGRPLEYLKIGASGFRTRYSSSVANAELLLIPFFEPDNLPTPDRFVLFDSLASVPTRDEERPATTYANTELALRVYRKIANADVSLYAYRGFWRTPGLKPDSFASPTRVTVLYPHLSVYGMSAQVSALRGVLSFETGYYQSRDDEDGGDPTTPNSQARVLVGYQRQLWEDSNLAVQYYAEIMQGHAAYQKSLPAGFPAQKAYRDVITLRLEQLLEHHTWKLSLMSFYSASDHDYLVQPQASYTFSDNLAATVGANIFGGRRDWSFFGQFDANDNVYLSVRFDF